MKKRTSRRVWVFAAGGVMLLAATALVVAAGRMAPVGLSASVRGGSKVIETVDTSLSTRSIEGFAADLGTSAMSVTWHGYLFVAEARTYRFEILTPGSVSFSIGQELLVDRKDAPRRLAPSYARISLPAGLHHVLLEHDRRTAANENFQLRWRDPNTSPPVPMPTAAFVARRPPDWLLALRPYVEPVALATASAWALVLIVCLGSAVVFAIRRIAPSHQQEPHSSKPMAAVLVVAAALFVVGIGWGIPGEGWAPDEIVPDLVLANGFSDAWPNKYPPLHFWLLALVYSPVLGFGAAAAIDPWSSQGATTMTVLGRLLSVAMATGTVALVGMLASRVFGRRAAAGAALCAATFLPFVYYAKMANLDVPYVFWFVLSLIFWHALRQDGRTVQYVAFGVAAALAVGTKDQAYGLYVFPAAFIAWGAWRREGTMGLGKVVAAGLGAAVAFACVHNLPLDIDGFRDHVAALTGTASTHYRMYPLTPAGEWHLGLVTLGQLLAGPGIAGIALVVTGVIVAMARPGRPGLWLFVPAVSYLLTFTAVVGYQYDRFLMPVFLVLATFAGCGLEWWRAQRRAGQVLAVMAVVTLLVRAASVNWVLLSDSRYAVEAWLEAHVQSRQTLGTFGKSLYLPRIEQYRSWPLNGSRENTEALRPDYVVINVEYMRRFESHSARQAWLEWLDRGEVYREAFRTRTNGAALGWLQAFRDDEETPFTNLDKPAAEYVVYERRKDLAPPTVR